MSAAVGMARARLRAAAARKRKRARLERARRLDTSFGAFLEFERSQAPAEMQTPREFLNVAVGRNAKASDWPPRLPTYAWMDEPTEEEKAERDWLEMDLRLHGPDAPSAVLLLLEIMARCPA